MGGVGRQRILHPTLALLPRIDFTISKSAYHFYIYSRGKWPLLFCSCHKWECRGGEKLSILPKITQPRRLHQHQSPKPSDLPLFGTMLSWPSLSQEVTSFAQMTLLVSLLNVPILATCEREPCSLSYPNPMGFSYYFRKIEAFLCS